MESVLLKLESDLLDCLKIEWDCSLTLVVGINVKQSDEGFTLHQEKLLQKITEDFWDGTSVAKTPLPLSLEPVADPEGHPATN